MRKKKKKKRKHSTYQELRMGRSRGETEQQHLMAANWGYRCLSLPNLKGEFPIRGVGEGMRVIGSGRWSPVHLLSSLKALGDLASKSLSPGLVLQTLNATKVFR